MKQKVKVLLFLTITILFVLAIYLLIIEKNESLDNFPSKKDIIETVNTEVRSVITDSKLKTSNTRVNLITTTSFEEVKRKIETEQLTLEMDSIPSTIKTSYDRFSCLENAQLKSSICLIESNQNSWILIDGVNTLDNSDLPFLSDVLDQLGNPEQVRIFQKHFETQVPLAYEYVYSSLGFTYITNGLDSDSEILGIIRYEPLLIQDYLNGIKKEDPYFGLIFLQN